MFPGRRITRPPHVAEDPTLASQSEPPAVIAGAEVTHVGYSAAAHGCPRATTAASAKKLVSEWLKNRSTVA